jgi:peptidoglycan hydrolase CwlO-like protein
MEEQKAVGTSARSTRIVLVVLALVLAVQTAFLVSIHRGNLSQQRTLDAQTATINDLKTSLATEQRALDSTSAGLDQLQSDFADYKGGINQYAETVNTAIAVLARRINDVSATPLTCTPDDFFNEPSFSQSYTCS